MAKNDNSLDKEVSLPIFSHLVGNTVLVFDIPSARFLYKNRFFGQPVGIKKPKTFEFNKPLQLNLFEAFYLLKKKWIKIYDIFENTEISEELFLALAKKLHEFFEQEYTVYEYLRDKGYVVRPGLKFGARFAVYEHGPGIDHAPFLVHVLPDRTKISAIDILRAGRLATTVRKKFIIAVINEFGKPEFYGFSWFKP
ncbi:MAG: tRNA-intron lyase [Candidatus Asgardarchaeia archaeon]